MTHIFKASAIAALIATTAAPAFAAAHMDLNSMTCEMYNQLTGADRDKIAMMAIAELNNNSDATIADNNGTATATAPLEGEAAEESPTGSVATIAESNGTATATSTVAAGDDMSRFAEEVAVLNRTCSRNWDTMVLEAAAGQDGTR